MDRARPTEGHAAAELGAGHPQYITEDPQQRSIAVDVDGVIDSIDFDRKGQGDHPEESLQLVGLVRRHNSHMTLNTAPPNGGGLARTQLLAPKGLSENTHFPAVRFLVLDIHPGSIGHLLLDAAQHPRNCN